jgi:F420-dependent oxidoreductase-like protein
VADGVTLRVMTEPQEGATYDDLLRVARATEDLGFDAFFRSDHLMRIGDGDAGPGSTEAWSTLAGLARETSRIRLGTMVSSATFRHPAVLALAVATVDAMSGGRVEVGLGSGWFEREHQAFGIPFPVVAERFDVLTEQLEIVTGLWDTPAGATYSFDGTHHTLADHPALPRPVQDPRPPVIVGGKGKRRTPELAARFADEYNVPFDTEEVVGACFDRVRAACGPAGRDPASVVLSTAQTVAVGRDDAEVRRRAAAIDDDVDRLRHAGLGGTVDEVVDKLGRLGELGATRVYLQVMDLTDLDHLELVATEVAPQL